MRPDTPDYPSKRDVLCVELQKYYDVRIDVSKLAGIKYFEHCL